MKLYVTSWAESGRAVSTKLTSIANKKNPRVLLICIFPSCCSEITQLSRSHNDETLNPIPYYPVISIYRLGDLSQVTKVGGADSNSPGAYSDVLAVSTATKMRSFLT